MVDVGHHQILNSTGQQVDSASHQSINPCFLGSPSFLALKQIGSRARIVGAVGVGTPAPLP